ncbi:MAG: hypothetical protein BKP49_09100 [Treponema sp. CETP13]|nr:MAG: hypothetical protein BKP49_09100 [Treponema sp. CETP13]
MTTKKIHIFSWIMITIYIGVLVYFILGISNKISIGQNYTEKEFFNTIQTISPIIEDPNSTTEDLQIPIKNIFANNSNITALLIHSKNRNMIFPSDSELLTKDSSGNKNLSTSSTLIKIYSHTSDTSEVTITIAMYLINPNDIYKLARVSFLIILAGTLLTIMFILFISNLTITEYREQPSEKKVKKNKPSFKIKSENLKRSSESKIDNIEQLSKLKVDNMGEPSESKLENIGEYVDEDENSNNINKKISDLEKQPVSDPLNVFSAITGYCHEKDLDSRLDSELSKAASAEYDLSLILFQIQNINHDDKLSKQIINIINSYYDDKNMIFNYKNNGYALLLQYKDLNDSMEFAEKLYTSVHELLLKNDVEANIGVGISTRSVRIIPNSRLILEAEQALHHAYEEPDLPIVAFKVNPEKYRQCLKESM